MKKAKLISTVAVLSSMLILASCNESETPEEPKGEGDRIILPTEEKDYDFIHFDGVGKYQAVYDLEEFYAPITEETVKGMNSRTFLEYSFLKYGSGNNVEIDTTNETFYQNGRVDEFNRLEFYEINGNRFENDYDLDKTTYVYEDDVEVYKYESVGMGYVEPYLSYGVNQKGDFKDKVINDLYYFVFSICDLGNYYYLYEIGNYKYLVNNSIEYYTDQLYCEATTDYVDIFAKDSIQQVIELDNNNRLLKAYKYVVSYIDHDIHLGGKLDHWEENAVYCNYLEYGYGEKTSLDVNAFYETMPEYCVRSVFFTNKYREVTLAGEGQIDTYGELKTKQATSVPWRYNNEEYYFPTTMESSTTTALAYNIQVERRYYDFKGEGKGETIPIEGDITQKVAEYYHLATDVIEGKTYLIIPKATSSSKYSFDVYYSRIDPTAPERLVFRD